jgi:putative transposase
MPWLACSPMSDRLAFITACLNRREAIGTISDRFGISEKTGYKWLARVKRDGLTAGLVERSHAWQTHSQQMAPEIAARIVALRQRHPKWGPVKLRDWLVQHAPAERWPAGSSIGALLHRLGLTHRVRRRDAHHATLHTPRARAEAPNAVWTADFKGHFRLGDSTYCYPLTVMDLHSRYVLSCRALPSTAVHATHAVFRQLFRTYGLPTVIRTDNGVPFAQANALGRLGSLAWWWIRLGIRPEHITPAAPQENGAHERFHKH